MGAGRSVRKAQLDFCCESRRAAREARAGVFFAPALQPPVARAQAFPSRRVYTKSPGGATAPRRERALDAGRTPWSTVAPRVEFFCSVAGLFLALSPPVPSLGPPVARSAATLASLASPPSPSPPPPSRCCPKLLGAEAGTIATPGTACGLDRGGTVHPHGTVTLIGNGIATMTTDMMIAEALLLDVTPLTMIGGIVAVHPRGTVGAKLFATSGARLSARIRVRPVIGAAICCLLTLPSQDLNEDHVQVLLESADVNERGGPYGSTPLGWAAQAGNTRLARLLIARSADPKIAAEKGSLPLHMAAWNGDFVEIVELLLEAGADPEAHNAHGQTALEVAKTLDHLERSSPWQEVFETRQLLLRNGPRGRARVIVALSKAMGVSPSAAMVEAAEAAAIEAKAAALQAAEATTSELGAGADSEAGTDDEKAVNSKSGAVESAGEEAAEMESLGADEESAAAGADDGDAAREESGDGDDGNDAENL
eukprot:scaffold63298_cov60-Phaeocystis_antarctica.AAC.2